MKLASIVLFLLTFGVTHGAKEAVESECSKHDNMAPEQAGGGGGDDGQAYAPESTPQSTPQSTPGHKEFIKQVDGLGETIFDFTQKAAKLASTNPGMANYTLKALRMVANYTINEYGENSGWNKTLKGLKAFKKELNAMIKNPAYMNTVFDAIAASDVTYKDLKEQARNKVQTTAAEQIENSDRAMRMVGLIIQASETLAQLGQSEMFKAALDSKVGDALRKLIGGLGAVVDWWNRWKSPNTADQQDTQEQVTEEKIEAELKEGDVEDGKVDNDDDIEEDIDERQS